MSQLRVHRLVLTGPGRNYSVEFGDGVTVVCGPISTGKSSVLQLIDYALGRRTPPHYPELVKCSDVLLECSAGGDRLTIRRSLKAAGAKALLYDASLEEVLTEDPPAREVSARHDKDQDSISLDLLNRLGFGAIKVKTAPTQAASDTSSFSVRDLQRLVYVDQDRVASASAFFENEPFNRIKWVAAFEIVHRIHDSAAAELSEKLQIARREHARLEHYLSSAQRFLDEARIPNLVALEETLTRLLDERRRLKDEHQQRAAGARALLGEDLALVRQSEALAGERQTLRARGAELARTLSNLGRLRVQYEREQEQLKFLQESKMLISSLPVTTCPACLQPLEEVTTKRGACHVCRQPLPELEESISVEARLTSLRRRIRDLDGYIGELEAGMRQADQRQKQLAGEIRDVEQSLARVRQGNLFAETQAMADIKEALAANDARLRDAQKNKALRQKALGDGSKLRELADTIRDLEGQVSKTEAKSVPSTAVVTALAAHFAELLESVRFPHEYGIGIDKKSYLPIVREQGYSGLSSKGAIALAVTCWHLAVLVYALQEGSRHPRLLLLDSPLSHVGKSADDPEFRDQRIVDAFYSLLADLQSSAGERFQVVIVDNSPPADIPLSRIQFTGRPGVGRYGLIDDEHPPTSEVDGSEST